MGTPPDGLTLERHRYLQGRLRAPWVRRVLLCCVAALPVLALLDVFGQHPSTVSAGTPAARLSLTAPTSLRGGLLFQARITVVPHREIHHLQLVFDEGWWDSMGVNSVKPEPESETSRGGKVVFEYGTWPAGRSLRVWINFQVNPTNVGSRAQDVALEDAGTTLATVHHSLRIFP
jgi:hypothetical protein